MRDHESDVFTFTDVCLLGANLLILVFTTLSCRVRRCVQFSSETVLSSLYQLVWLDSETRNICSVYFNLCHLKLHEKNWLEPISI